MSLKLKDMIYVAWIIIAIKKELRTVIKNFGNAVLEFEFSEEELRAMLRKLRRI